MVADANEGREDRTMSVTDDEITTLVDYCEANLGDPNLWKTPDGYPDSLALCIIDAIYSTGSHYSSVVNVINRYIEAGGSKHGARDLRQSITAAGGGRGWAETVAQNVKPAHTRAHAQLKAEVIEQAADLMIEHKIDTVPDFVSCVRDNLRDNDVFRAWKRLPSQSSGVTYNYLLILAGLPSIKPDRMVLSFLSDALGEDAELSEDRAIDLLEATANRIGVDPRALDHIAWRAASGRELTD